MLFCHDIQFEKFFSRRESFSGKGRGRLGRGFFAGKVFNGAGEYGPGRLALVGGVLQELFFLFVGYKAYLYYYGGHGCVPGDVKIYFVYPAAGAFENPGKLFLDEPGGLLAFGRAGLDEGLGAAPAGGGKAVHVDAEVEVGLVVVGQGHPPAQVLPLFCRQPNGAGVAQVGVGLPGHQHHRPRLPQIGRQAPADGKGDVLFQGAALPHHARVVTAVAGVHHDHPAGQRGRQGCHGLPAGPFLQKPGEKQRQYRQNRQGRQMALPDPVRPDYRRKQKNPPLSLYLLILCRRRPEYETRGIT
ncbi:hypothetical protein PTH_0362 [Pelotomaculum thermopropionicum SI]|uniref:Uncharacterized protein n=1 Tax=Pelotomaculum thermopropionicum (strain DSM 13744 / JCM 10971 / SI) TaxID=370438 RepID=A5D5C3_PELTS|nr:hypothetical protein PTH_0362 [Pelotomaculum thermopropionicum SI]